VKPPCGAPGIHWTAAGCARDTPRRISAKDSAKYAQFALSLEKTARFFRQLTSITPPAIDKPTPEDLWSLLKTGRSVRILGKSGIFDLLRWGPMAVADFVAEFFESELLRAVIAARGIFGAALGPWSAGSTAVLLLRAAAVLMPTITAPTRSSAMNTSKLRRCWVASRAICAAGIPVSPRRLWYASAPCLPAR